MLYLGTSFLLPFYLELGKEFSPDISDLFLLIPALALILTSFFAPNFRLLMSYAQKGDEGMISGIAMTVRNTGSATGIAVFTMLFVLASGKVFANTLINSVQRDLGFHAAFQFGFLISLFILLMAFFSHEKKEISEAETPGN